MCRAILHVHSGCEHDKAGNDDDKKAWDRLVKVCKAGFSRKLGCRANDLQQLRRYPRSLGPLCDKCMDHARGLLEDRYAEEIRVFKLEVAEQQQNYAKVKAKIENHEELLQEKDELEGKVQCSQKEEADLEDQLQDILAEKREAELMEDEPLLQQTTNKADRLNAELSDKYEAREEMEQRIFCIDDEIEADIAEEIERSDKVENFEMLLNASEANRAEDLESFEEDPMDFYDPQNMKLDHKFESFPDWDAIV